MQVVNTVQVHVFFMPAEEGAPDAHVQVGLRHPRDVLLLHAVATLHKYAQSGSPLVPLT